MTSASTLWLLAPPFQCTERFFLIFYCGGQGAGPSCIANLQIHSGGGVTLQTQNQAHVHVSYLSKLFDGHIAPTEEPREGRRVEVHYALCLGSSHLLSTKGGSSY